MTNILSKYHNELDELIVRFDSFLEKLEVRAHELYEETKVSAQEISDADERSYYHFKLGIEGQFRALSKKAEDVFLQQIKAREFHRLPHETVNVSEKEADLYDKRIQNIEDKLEAFTDKVNTLIYKAFKEVQAPDPYEKLQLMLDGYEKIKSNFCCTQCGAPIKLQKMYYVSAYVNCEFCQTQNTFTPSTNMAMLPDLVRDIAEKETLNLEKKYTDLTRFDDHLQIFLAYETWKREHFFVKKHIVPELTTSYKDIYLREINDLIRYQFEDTDRENKSLYFSIVNHFGENYVPQKINQTDISSFEKDYQEQFIDELILDLTLNQELLSKKRFETSDTLQETHQKIKNQLIKIQEFKDNFKTNSVEFNTIKNILN